MMRIELDWKNLFFMNVNHLFIVIFPNVVPLY